MELNSFEKRLIMLRGAVKIRKDFRYYAEQLADISDKGINKDNAYIFIEYMTKLNICADIIMAHINKEDKRQVISESEQFLTKLLSDLYITDNKN